MWESFINENSRCRLCHDDSILDSYAFPIIQKTKPKNTDLLFVLEAPNHVDTYDPDKGYLTIDPDADPSICFFYELYTEVLELDIEDLFITNSVLCLPKKFASLNPVTTLQRIYCSGILKQTIDLFQPRIVCTIGFQSLKSLGIIEPHGFVSMKSAVGVKTIWYDRILFPLYHTSMLARLDRSREEKVKDWLELRKTISALKLSI